MLTTLGCAAKAVRRSPRRKMKAGGQQRNDCKGGLLVTIELKLRDGWLEPVVCSTTPVTVGDLVYTCHEQTIDRALSKYNIPGLDRDTLDGILTYCAEQRCAGDHATCPGCNRRSQERGFATLDDFVAAHKTIEVKNRPIVLKGDGHDTLQIDSLDRLEKSWSGETYWYWARRILRKLRHGVRRAGNDVEAFGNDGTSPTVILKDAQLADNIGMVARAMGNFGLDELRLVNPRDGWPNDKARIAASGANYIIDHARAFDSLDDASGDLNWLAATTARQRDLRKPVMTPAQAMAELRRRIGQGERCGILFGGESSGLENADIARADAAVMIPVNPQFASLNLAQAVLLLGYEWSKDLEGVTLGRVTTYERALEPGLHFGNDRPATKAQMAQFFEHLETELERRGFFSPPEKRQKLVTGLRTMFTRMAATDQEIRTLRGIVATLAKGKLVAPKSKT